MFQTILIYVSLMPNNFKLIIYLVRSGSGRTPLHHPKFDVSLMSWGATGKSLTTAAAVAAVATVHTGSHGNESHMKHIS